MSKTINLSLKPREKADRIIRLTIGLKESLLDDIALYAIACEEVYGDSMTDREIIDQILTDFFAKEKGFQEWKRLGGERINKAVKELRDKRRESETKKEKTSGSAKEQSAESMKK